ncbi:MAG: hypothetical protein ACJAYC_002674 [Halieaceae bacterium]|jgi:hypothetical protein
MGATNNSYRPVWRTSFRWGWLRPSPWIARGKTELGFWSGLFNKDAIVHVALPVFSAVNPTEKNVQPLAFAAALIKPKSVNSRVVMGYLHIQVSQARVVDAAISSMSGLIVFTVIFALSMCAMVMLVSWPLGSSLAQLAKLAGDVAN